MIFATMHQLNMGPEPYLKDFVKVGVLRIDHSLEDRKQLIKKKSMKLMIFFKRIQDQVFGLLLKPLRYYQQQQQHIEL